MSAPTPTIKGLTTIVWGTGSVLGTPSGAIVESVSVSPKNGEPIEIEDNNGFAVTEILLLDGFDATVTLIYDTSKTWPAEGATVALSLPTTGGAGGKTSFNCLLCSYAPNLARKKEATTVMKLRYRPGITLT